MRDAGVDSWKGVFFFSELSLVLFFTNEKGEKRKVKKVRFWFPMPVHETVC